MGGHLIYTISYDSAVRDGDDYKEPRGHPNIMIEVGMFVDFYLLLFYNISTFLCKYIETCI